MPKKRKTTAMVPNTPLLPGAFGNTTLAVTCVVGGTKSFWTCQVSALRALMKICEYNDEQVAVMLYHWANGSLARETLVIPKKAAYNHDMDVRLGPLMAQNDDFKDLIQQYSVQFDALMRVLYHKLNTDAASLMSPFYIHCADPFKPHDASVPVPPDALRVRLES
jgi:hypothetical protein